MSKENTGEYTIATLLDHLAEKLKTIEEASKETKVQVRDTIEKHKILKILESIAAQEE